MEAIRGSQKSLILVARQLGIHIGPNDIPERFKIDDRELSLKEINFSVNLNLGAIPNGGPASSKFEKFSLLEKINGGS